MHSGGICSSSLLECHSSGMCDEALDLAPDGAGEGSPLDQTRQAMKLINAIVVVLPVVFGVLAHLNREGAAMGPLFWLWALLSVACLFWWRYVSRRYRSLAWGCLAVGMLQLISFLFLFMAIDFPANTRSVPSTPPPTRNSHDW